MDLFILYVCSLLWRTYKQRMRQNKQKHYFNHFGQTMAQIVFLFIASGLRAFLVSKKQLCMFVTIFKYIYIYTRICCLYFKSMDNIKTFSLYHSIFHKKHGCNFFPYVRFIFYISEKKNLHKSSTVKKKHWVREIYLTRQNDNEDLKTSTHMMQHDKGANKHPYSRPSTPPTFTNSRTRCDESFPFWNNQFHAIWSSQG